MSNELRELSQTIPCAYCGAEVDTPCTHLGGRRASAPHASRYMPISKAYGLGFNEGYEAYRQRVQRQERRLG